jgi:hypothetical protein
MPVVFMCLPTFFLHMTLSFRPLHELPDYNWIRRRSYWLRY